MGVIVAVEQRYMRTPDGATWTSTAIPYDHWRRYLRIFGEVCVLGRVLTVPSGDPSWLRVDGDGVEVAALPYYVGPSQYLRRYFDVRRSVRQALATRREHAVILRVPGTIAAVAAHWLREDRRPFGVEVVADPFEVFAPGAFKHPLRPYLRWTSRRHLRALCTRASAALYVTSANLQARYPPAPGGASFSASNVDAPNEAFVPEPRDVSAPAGQPFRLVTVGTLETLYKAPDVLIETVARLGELGTDVALTIVGDGRHRAELEGLARRLGVSERVTFAGRLPSGEAVRRELDRAHLFVMPSKTEGLPRAMVEAMARGLPCVGTPVGGIPELLPPDALVAGDPASLAARIREVASSAALRAEMSRRNLERAREFHQDVLQPIRERFYTEVAAAAREWTRTSLPSSHATST